MTWCSNLPSCCAHTTSEHLDAWLAQVENSQLPELLSFEASIEKDKAAGLTPDDPVRDRFAVQGAQVVDLAGVVEVTPQITFAIGVALSLVMALVALLLLKNPGRAEHV